MGAAHAILPRPTEPGRWILPFARFSQTCASPDCLHRGKLWPAWLRRSQGVQVQGQWFCEIFCAERALEAEFQRLLQTAREVKRKSHRIPLGLLLVSRGAITGNQLQQALKLQRENGREKLGYWLRKLDVISESDLTAALGVQWRCPVFPLERHHAYLECARMLPFALLESAGLLPVHFSPESRMLYLVCTDRIDHVLLYSIESILECHAVPCVAPQSAVAEAMEQVRQLTNPAETVFDSLRHPGEMASIARNYALNLAPTQIQLTRAGEYIWVRYELRTSSHDMLFQIRPTSETHAIG